MPEYLLVIDQGTTNTTATIFNRSYNIAGIEQKELTQYFVENGWVEHDPEEIWQNTLGVVAALLQKLNIASSEIAGIGITNQRETTILWDKNTGVPIYNAIVWQDRRTAEFCAKLKKDGLEEMVQLKTGLLLDPYFSASKIKWLLDNVSNARRLAENGELLFGTVDTFLLWRLTNGKVHATDSSNASRTMLYNIHTNKWDPELLRYFAIPEAILPAVKDTIDIYGNTEIDAFKTPIKILSLIGDQQASLIGHGCFEPGKIKSTYGTGCFMIMNTGDKAINSKHRLLTTIAYSYQGKTTYAIEGSIFVAGATVQWLRDALQLIDNAHESEEKALQIADTDGVYLVPAFTGLGAPYWDPTARGAILGLTRNSSVDHIVRAGLESVCYQTKDLLLTMQKDSAINVPNLKVDGGMVVNDWLMQFLADILNIGIDTAVTAENTSLGCALAVGLQLGWFEDMASMQDFISTDNSFYPNMAAEEITRLYAGWQDAVNMIRKK